MNVFHVSELRIQHPFRTKPLDYASWKERKDLAAAIKPIYTAASAEPAAAELDAFEGSVAIMVDGRA
jgi:transposase-like protein